MKRTIRLGRYSGDLRQWILEFKYRRWIQMGEFLAERLAEQIASHGLLNAIREETSEAIVVPVPMPMLRSIHRGLDHAGVLARTLAGRLDLPTARPLRRRMGNPQMVLPRTSRHRGRELGIKPRSWPFSHDLSGAAVILVDDVRTTGATATACARYLRRLGASQVVGAFLAVADDVARR